MLDVSFGQYCRLEAWNWSTIKLFARSARAVRWSRDRVDDGDTASRRWLRAVHAAVLEGERDYVVYDGVRRGKQYDAFAAANAGKDVLNPREAAAIDNVVEAVMAHPEARAVLSSGQPEVTVTWAETINGVELPMKGRIDWYDRDSGTLMDLKTCGTTNPRAVASMVARHGWHGQLAHYAAGLEACGQPVRRVLLLAAQGKEEQDVAVYELSGLAPDGALHAGRQLRSEYLTRLACCVQHDDWPGAVPGVEDLCLPDWALSDGMDLSGLEEA